MGLYWGVLSKMVEMIYEQIGKGQGKCDKCNKSSILWIYTEKPKLKLVGFCKKCKPEGFKDGERNKL